MLVAICRWIKRPRRREHGVDVIGDMAVFGRMLFEFGRCKKLKK